MSNIINNNSMSQIYYKMPYISEEKYQNRCVACKSELKARELLIAMTNMEYGYTSVRPIKLLYCEKCSIGYANKTIKKYLEEKENIDKPKYIEVTRQNFLSGYSVHKLSVLIRSKPDNMKERVYYMSPYLHKCKSPNTRMIRQRYGEVPYQSNITISLCNSCNRKIVSALWIKYIYPYMTDKAIIVNGEGEIVSDKIINKIVKNYNETSEESYEICDRESSIYKGHLLYGVDFIVVLSPNSCNSRGHKLEDVTCVISITQDHCKIEKWKIPAFYCLECEKYYILKNDYIELKKKGTILCQVKEMYVAKSKDRISHENRLHEESLIHSFGYSVSEKDGLSNIRRWNILESLILNDVLKRAQIVSFLDWLIDFNMNNERKINAVQLWAEDREHIANLEISAEKKQANSIEIKKYIRKGK